MAQELAARIDTEELQALLTSREPGVVLAPPRILRRIIKQDRRITGLGLQVPHRKSYCIGRDVMFEIADRSELEVSADRELPDRIILIARPDPERLARLSPDEVLIKYWRLLFHAKVHAHFQNRIVTSANVRDRLRRLGLTEFDEIRTVLKQENFLLPPRDDAEAYEEFAALYLELRYFAATLLPCYFPGIADWQQVDDVLALDIDAAELFTATRLPGAPDPVFPAAAASALPSQMIVPAARSSPSPGRFAWLNRRADKASAKGNVVRAAILRQRAIQAAGPDQVADQVLAMRRELGALAGRLQFALDLDDAGTRDWLGTFTALVPRAAAGYWPVERRLLYDLQKVCVDRERDIFALGIVQWILSLGRRPIKRLLPNQREVIMTKHLRAALRHVQAVQIPDRERRLLSRLVQEALDKSEEHLRRQFRPQIDRALELVGLGPANLPERIARQKLVEELLDLVVERGHLAIGDLRDAISRNNLKLPDLGSFRELAVGDPLIRLNRRLAVGLDGVYHGAEIYLRWLQRIGSMAFGTPIGRFLVLYLVLPFGVAFVTIEGTMHLINPFLKWLERPRIHLTNEEMGFSVGLLGAFLFALMHIGSFRQGFGRLMGHVRKGLKKLLVDWPRSVLQLPAVRWILDSQPIVLFRQYALKPLVVTALVSAFFPLYGARPPVARAASALVFVFSSVLFNTPWGRNMDELVADALGRTWVRFRIDIFPAIFGFVMALFKTLVEGVERFLYVVDEWLRFRTGENRLLMAAKAILGFIWFFVTYLVRIYVNLLIEPTVNPIKHFPVVTVAAKLIVPFIPFLLDFFAAPFLPFGRVAATTIATMNIILLPGVFGFMVWEFKENWRLYAANRPKGLRPVMIGHHGENMGRLLRPGIHSGTVPKLYARWRRAERVAHGTGSWRGPRRHVHALSEVKRCVRRFVDREFVALLAQSLQWGTSAPFVGEIRIGLNRIAIELRPSRDSDQRLWLTYEERASWLLGNIDPGVNTWALSPEQERAFDHALAGLYKMAGVDLVRRQIGTELSPASFDYDVDEEGLIVWSRPDGESQAHYELRDGEVLEPAIRAGKFTRPLPVLEKSKLLFRDTPIPWQTWVEWWDGDQAGRFQE
jgi:hypothetical protein